MTIEILFINCNRLGYTRKATAALLADPTPDLSISIWDNASTDGTKEFLESIHDPRIQRKVLARENVYLTGAANEIFGNSKADLLAIIPDDFLVPPGWTKPLAAVHEEAKDAGLISAWFLGEKFFDERRAQHKIQNLGRHRILRHPWTGGGAALFKRQAWEEADRFKGIGTPDCWKRMAARGYVNGFILPPVFVEHMDEPWSPHYSGKPSPIRKLNGCANDQQVWEFHLAVLREILDGPWDIKHYQGWRGKWRSRFNRLRRRLAKSRFGTRPPAIPLVRRPSTGTP